jgi:hypothetical protein
LGVLGVLRRRRTPRRRRLGIMTALAGEDGHSLVGRATVVSVSGIVGKIVLSAICDQQTSSAP